MIARKFSSTMLTAVCTLAALGWTANALANAANTVEFRMSDWKTMQFQDAAKAQAHHDALTRLGCEVIQENQGGRIDVRYRCMNWKRLAFANHGEAHEWETWLRNSGFQVRHAH